MIAPLVPASPGQDVNPKDVAAVMAAAAERQRASVQQAMAPGLGRQRQSVRTQVRGAVERDVSSDAFFTIPWPTLMAEVAVSAECDPLPSTEVETLVAENARAENLKPELLREVMRRESAFRPCAMSRAGAQGLMQLMPATASQFHVSDVFDPRQNASAGAKFLKTLLNRYGGDMALALGAYNAGPGRVDEAGGVPEIPETQSYVSKILSAID